MNERVVWDKEIASKIPRNLGREVSSGIIYGKTFTAVGPLSSVETAQSRGASQIKDIRPGTVTYASKSAPPQMKSRTSTAIGMRVRGDEIRDVQTATGQK